MTRPDPTQATAPDATEPMTVSEAAGVSESIVENVSRVIVGKREAIEDVLGEFAADRFGAVYSVETLQHVHPDSEPVFAELARTTGELLVTVENEQWEGATGERASDDRDERGYDVDYVDEGVPIYYRDWGQVFTDLGLIEIECQSGPRDTLRAFRSAAGRGN